MKANKILSIMLVFLVLLTPVAFAQNANMQIFKKEKGFDDIVNENKLTKNKLIKQPSFEQFRKSTLRQNIAGNLMNINSLNVDFVDSLSSPSDGDSNPMSSGGVEINPNVPNTENDLFCTVDGDYFGYEFVWRIDSETYSGYALNSLNTQKGDRVYCDAYVVTPHGSNFVGTASITIVDFVPEFNYLNPSNTNIDLTEGETQRFAVHARDPDGDSVSYSWELNTNAVSILDDYNFIADEDGGYTLRVVASDGQYENRNTWYINVADVDPIVTLPMTTIPTISSGQPIIQTYEGGFVNLDLIVKTLTQYDPITAIDIDWGDGQSGNFPGAEGLQSFSHQYVDSDTSFNGVVTVYDEDSFTEWTFTVVVTDVNPIVDAGLDVNGVEGEVVLFDSYAVADGSSYDLVTSVNVDFGDGNLLDITDPVDVANVLLGTYPITNVYSDQGQYTVTFTVYDEDSSAQDTLTVDIVDIDPAVDAGLDQTVNEGEVVTFDSYVVSVMNAYDALSQLDVDFGDGNILSITDLTELDNVLAGTSQITNVYSDQGQYTVTFTVYDEDSFVQDNLIVDVLDVDPIVDAGLDQTVMEGDLVTFDSYSVAEANAFDLVTRINVDFGDGNVLDITDSVDVAEVVAGTYLITHTYADQSQLPVEFTVTFTTYDEDSFVQDTLLITVTDFVSQVDAGSDQTVMEGDQIVFNDYSYTDSPYDQATSLVFDFGDGSLPEEHLADTSVSHIYVDDNQYTVTVTLTDEDSSVQDTLTVLVNDLNPTVDAGLDLNGVEGQVITFNEFVVTDNQYDQITLIEVDYGDLSPLDTFLDLSTFNNAIANGLITHVYADNDVYTLTVTAYDEDSSVQDTTVVTVSDVDPTVDVTGVSSLAVEGQTYILTGVVVTDDPYDQITSVQIDFGDSNVVTYSDLALFNSDLANGLITNVYADNDVYTLTVTAYDEDSSVQDTAVVTVSDVDPTANAGVDLPLEVEGQSVGFTGFVVTENVDDLISQIVVDYGDGNQDVFNNLASFVATSLVHTYVDQGVYTVTLTANDEDSFAQDTIVVTVADISPIVDAGIDKLGYGGVPVVFDDFTYTDNLYDQVTSIVFDFGDGSPTEENFGNNVVTHTYANVGQYTVTVTFTDEDNSVQDILLVDVQPAVGDLSGVITDDLGNTIYGATVVLRQGSTTIATTNTDATGSYSFIGVQAGTYDLVVGKTGFNVQTVTNVVVNIANIAIQNVVLTPIGGAGAISGIVYLQIGSLLLPESNIMVEIYETGTNNLIQVVYTDATGNYVVQGLAPSMAYDLFAANVGVTTISPATNVLVAPGVTSGGNDIIITMP